MVEDRQSRTGNKSVSSAQIRAWCDDASLPGERGELSDIASILISSGFLTPSGRAIVVRRVSTGLPIPVLPNGFGDLRRLQRAVAQVEHQLANPMVPSVVAAVLRNRFNGLSRKREDARKVVVTGKGVFPGGTRAVRRERRENIYLEIEERERLFAGLTCTPTPNVNTSGYMRRAGTVAMDRLAGVVGQFASKSGYPQAGEWASQILSPPADEPDPAPTSAAKMSVFADGYETLLFLAGHFYDRIMRNPAWRSDHFEVQRTQVNLHGELAEISADVIALRAVRIDLDRARRNGGFDREFAQSIDKRETTLRPVWTELIDRVQALGEVARVVESAAVELRVLAEYDRASTIDDRIDELIARSGDREISRDNAMRLTEQVRSGEEQLRMYRDVLQGNIARIGPGAYTRQLPERYERS